jgi:hypothetical protein
VRWHEKGEHSNKYFYSILKHRAQGQCINHLYNAETDSLSSSNPNDILNIASSYYKKLFSPEQIIHEDVEQMISSIPDHICLQRDQSEKLWKPISFSELSYTITSSPRNKSPGLDGLPFEIYNLILSHPYTKALLLDIMNDAMKATFPASWQKTKLILLYKKGDATRLDNWRPLSLINSDAKIFTKILSNRLNTMLPKLINQYQTGFMPGRLIANNGWALQTMMAHARNIDPNGTTAGVLLDQEKAYDRIHPEYLAKVLMKFGFPEAFIKTITAMFFQTKVHIAINGYLAAPITQGRGLRQGDPISPLLFNLAFEPLLRRLLAEIHLQGFPMQKPLCRPLSRSSSKHYGRRAYFPESIPIKLLAYADDLLMILSDPQEWQTLSLHLQTYNNASNAKVNLKKTAIFTLAGNYDEKWYEIASTAGCQWHDNSASTPLIYLGFPVFHQSSQLDVFLAGIYQKITNYARILNVRNLSVQGRALLANSMLLSRLWYIIRVTIVPKKWLALCQTTIKQFIYPHSFKPSWEVICKPKSQGGLSVVNLKAQNLTLHWVYVLNALCPKKTNFASILLRSIFRAYTGQANLVVLPLLPDRLMRAFSKIPQMMHICKLLSALPQLKIDDGWPSHVLMQFPASLIIYRPLAVQLIVDISPGYTADDFFDWSHNTIMRRRRSPVKDRKTNSVLRELEGNKLQIIPAAQQYEIWNPNRTERPFEYHTVDDIPKLDHWIMQNGKYQSIKMSGWTTGIIRNYWRNQDAKPLPMPPMRLSSRWYETIPKSKWINWWKLPLVHEARSSWWRLLHDKLMYRKRLHSMDPIKYPSSTCPLCKKEDEDEYHFVVGCHLKWEAWKKGLDIVQYPSSSYIQPLDIWQTLLLQHRIEVSTEKRHPLVSMSIVWAAIWKTHWFCTIEQQPWSLQMCL